MDLIYVIIIYFSYLLINKVLDIIGGKVTIDADYRQIMLQKDLEVQKMELEHAKPKKKPIGFAKQIEVVEEEEEPIEIPVENE